MSPLPRQYWASRLNDGLALWIRPVYPDVHMRGRWPWPEWISRKALWDDYVLWAACKGEDPGTVTNFFKALKPYLYPDGRPATGTSFKVIVQTFSRGRWYGIPVRRKFIRLMPLAEARQHFEYRRRVDNRVNEA